MAGELYPTSQWAAPMPPSSQSANLPVPAGWGTRSFPQHPAPRGAPWRRYGAAIQMRARVSNSGFAVRARKNPTRAPAAVTDAIIHL